MASRHRIQFLSVHHALQVVAWLDTLTWSDLDHGRSSPPGTRSTTVRVPLYQIGVHPSTVNPQQTYRPSLWHLLRPNLRRTKLHKNHIRLVRSLLSHSDPIHEPVLSYPPRAFVYAGLRLSTPLLILCTIFILLPFMYFFPRSTHPILCICPHFPVCAIPFPPRPLTLWCSSPDDGPHPLASRSLSTNAHSSGPYCSAIYFCQVL